MTVATCGCQSVSASLLAGSKTVTVFAAFVAVAALVVAASGPEWRRGGRDLLDLLVQGRLVVLDPDDQGDVGVCCDGEMFFLAMQRVDRLRAETGCKFHALSAAVSRAKAHTPRISSLVENLNSRLRTYFTLRRHLGGSYLDLLRFFLNHRRFMRSRRAERPGKSPRELMTGQDHPHWLALLGLGPLQPQQT